MFSLPEDASDDDLRDTVKHWFTLIANGALAEADRFLDKDDSRHSLGVSEFLNRVHALAGGGKVSLPRPNSDTVDSDDLPFDEPVDIVCRWIPGSEATEKYPGVIADILHSVPMNGEWSDINASFFVRSERGHLSLQLRDVKQWAD